MWRLGLIGLTLGLVGCQSNPSASPVRTDTLSLSKTSPPPPVPHPYWTDLARLLAGIPPKDTFYWREVMRDTVWQNYARRVDYLWSNRRKTLYDSLQVWAARELGIYHEWNETVFYPFSGADWPTIYFLYPRGKRYIFFGLEQEGDPHELSRLKPLEIAHSLEGTYATLADLLRLTFFKTKEMQIQLAHGKVRGLLPVFLALLARTGQIIYEVQHIYLRAGGVIDTLSSLQPKPAQSAWDNPITGLRFVVGMPDAPLQEVIYLSLNAADAGVKKQIGSYDFLSRLGPCVTLIKSASYLLFSPEFNEMRKLILTQSVAILQEDSGIPYRFFDTTAWNIQLYGVYYAPIPLFKSKYQADLWQAYRKQPVRSLPFGIGYHIPVGTSNLLWAVRKDFRKPLPPIPVETLRALPVRQLPPPARPDSSMGMSVDSSAQPALPTAVPSGGSE
ncbi:MAG: hypothetical protein NZ580_06625 [Bacteroidia bacterium]|nr:hypothetical protein [Bacteroidia bacterium]MDW8236401.1 hypothetical protein [Bacteroidia bacterium]